MYKNAEVLTVNSDNKSGELRVVENSEKMNFVIPNGSSVTVVPGLLVEVLIITEGGQRKAIIIKPKEN